MNSIGVGDGHAVRRRAHRSSTLALAAQHLASVVAWMSRNTRTRRKAESSSGPIRGCRLRGRPLSASGAPRAIVLARPHHVIELSDHQQVDLTTIIKGAVETSAPVINQARHRLHVAVPAEPIVLDADPVRLEQVFANLLNNAAKFMSAGGDIWLLAWREGDEAVITVRDKGIGIAPEHLSRIFEMFTQVLARRDSAIAPARRSSSTERGPGDTRERLGYAGRMSGRCPTLLAVSLALGACAGELGEPGATAPPAAVSAPAPVSGAAMATAPGPQTRRERLRRSRGPANGMFVVSHFSAGVFATLLVQPATYLLAARVGDTGHGLGPAVGALLIGAFVPPILNYTLQWAVGREFAPGRDRFWPGFLVRQAAHLGIFAGAVVGGVDFHNLGQATALVLGEAFVNSGLSTMTAELTRRPRAATPGATTEVVVPVLELKF